MNSLSHFSRPHSVHSAARMVPSMLLLIGLIGCLPPASCEEGEPSYVPIFNGKSLEGWSCIQEGVFTVEDGAIVGKNTAESPIPDNRFLVWQGGKPGDFDLKLEFKIEGPEKANSGIQFRGDIREDGHVVGYQADIDRGGKWIGMLYDEHTGRKALAQRGEKTVIAPDGTRETTSIGDPDELLEAIRFDDWNEYHISARGPRIVLRINGVVMSEVVDREEGEADREGIIALQVHKGPPMVVRFRKAVLGVQ